MCFNDHINEKLSDLKDKNVENSQSINRMKRIIDKPGKFGNENILRTIKLRKGNWIGHILRRNCFLKHIIEEKLEGRIKVTRRRGRKCKQLLDDLKERRWYWKLEEEALDHTLETSLWKRLWPCRKTV
jgi:hypothetical protein